MHISEGILPVWALVSGAGLTLSGLYVGFKHLTPKKMPETALFTAGFFVASLIHVPIGPTSSHLILNGLIGIILGWRAIPAIFIALLLQAILFQFGGLTTIGVNTVSMGIPAILCHMIVSRYINESKPSLSSIIGAFGAAFAVLMSGVLTALFLSTAGEGFWLAAKMLLIAHVPVAIAEAFVTGFAIRGLLKIRPEVFR